MFAVSLETDSLRISTDEEHASAPLPRLFPYRLNFTAPKIRMGTNLPFHIDGGQPLHLNSVGVLSISPNLFGGLPISTMEASYLRANLPGP